MGVYGGSQDSVPHYNWFLELEALFWTPIMFIMGGKKTADKEEEEITAKS
jgi:hypothetical protein